MWRSVPQTPQAAMRMSAALGGTSGFITSRIMACVPGPSYAATRTVGMGPPPESMRGGTSATSTQRGANRPRTERLRLYDKSTQPLQLGQPLAAESLARNFHTCLGCEDMKVGMRHRLVLDVSGDPIYDRRSTTGFARTQRRVSVGCASTPDNRGVCGPGAGDKSSQANVEFLRYTMWGAARRPGTYVGSFSGRIGGPHDRTRS